MGNLTDAVVVGLPRVVSQIPFGDIPQRGFEGLEAGFCGASVFLHMLNAIGKVIPIKSAAYGIIGVLCLVVLKLWNDGKEKDERLIKALTDWKMDTSSQADKIAGVVEKTAAIIEAQSKRNGQ